MIKIEKNYITEEDTLEILYIRSQLLQKDPSKIRPYQAVIDEIFVDKTKDNDGNVLSTKRNERLNFMEFLDKMYQLSLDKRKTISENKKKYCEFNDKINSSNSFNNKSKKK